MVFNRQHHCMTSQMIRALNLLCSHFEDVPYWLADIINISQSHAHFQISKEQAMWVAARATLWGAQCEESNAEMLYLQSQFDPNHYFYLNSGICSPSY